MYSTFQALCESSSGKPDIVYGFSGRTSEHERSFKVEVADMLFTGMVPDMSIDEQEPWAMYNIRALIEFKIGRAHV